jgi:alpha-L-rhamnosidase
MGGNRWLFLGDWANPHGQEVSDSREASLFNNCYYVYVLKIASDIAHILEMEDIAEAYRTKARKVSEAVNRSFYDPIHYTYIDTRQTHLVMPLIAGIVPEKDIPQVEQKLREEILVNQDGHFDTGIHGTYYLTRYLTETGRHELLNTLMNQTTYPGFGEIISRGEITWPEYWHPVNSRVHGCLNGIGGWFQRGILGMQINPETPGYKHFLIKPAFLDSLQWAKGHHISPYGSIEVSWEKTKDSYILEIDIPENTSASVIIPARSENDITENARESGKALQDARGVSFIGMENGNAVLNVGSGHYKFVTKHE